MKHYSILLALLFAACAAIPPLNAQEAAGTDPAKLIEAAENGDIKAQIKLGDNYAKGVDVEKDLEKAADWYRKAADRGNAGAEYKLIETLITLGDNAKGDNFEIEKNLQAVKWYRMAADRGLTGTAAAAEEKAAEQGDAEPLDSLRETADNGNAEAQYNLGLRHENGDGVEKDLKKALSSYSKAAEQGL